MTLKQSHISFEGNKPQNVQFSQTDDQLQFVVKQQPLNSVAVLGYPFLAFVIVGLLAGIVGSQNISVFFLLLGMMIILPTILLIYLFQAQNKNKTIIYVSRKSIIRLSEPMRLPKQSFEINLSDIQSMRIGTSIHRVSSWYAYNTYEIQAITFSGKVQPIINRLASSDTATYILRQIEVFLNGN